MEMFYYDTDKKLLEIFTEHCNLSAEQYEEIRAQLIYLVSDIQEAEPMSEIEKRIEYLLAVFEFLYNTKELTLKENAALVEMVEEIEKQIFRKALAEGKLP